MITKLFTIGYAGFGLPEFLTELKKRQIQLVIDVRSQPFSKYYADYNKDRICNALKNENIYYRNYAKEFGARQENKVYYSSEGYLDFSKFSKEIYIHHFEQKSDTGVEMNLLQEYTFICLDIFDDIIQNEDRKIENRLEEWLVFLSQDDPDMIMKLLDRNPEFQKIYEEIYTLCLNMEGMMEMFSKELEILDRNTVKLMIDELDEALGEEREKVKAIKQERETLKAEKESLEAEKELIRLRAELEKLRK